MFVIILNTWKTFTMCFLCVQTTKLILPICSNGRKLRPRHLHCQIKTGMPLTDSLRLQSSPKATACLQYLINQRPWAYQLGDPCLIITRVILSRCRRVAYLMITLAVSL